jgi:hypothetical protein
MAEAQDFDSSDDYQKLTLRWMAAGHEVVHDRGTFRHKAYRKEFAPDTPVMMDGAQMIMSNGHALVAGDILPERADLALDMDGNVLPQHEFAKRYLEFLQWFTMVEGSDTGSEYIPAGCQYITQMPDPFSESPGMVEIGFDARKPAEEERTHRWDEANDKMVEVMQTQNEGIETALSAVKELLEKGATAPKNKGGRPRKEVSA